MTSPDEVDLPQPDLTQLSSGPMLIPHDDRWLLGEGAHNRLHHVLGAQPLTDWAHPGRRFAVWAPEAAAVWVVGDFNGWNTSNDAALISQGSSGIWAGTDRLASAGDRYKFRIMTKSGDVVDRADPVAFATELAPATASVVADLSYEWADGQWIAERGQRQRYDQPISIYEMHVGSWRHIGAHKSFSWSELADPLADYLIAHGFTHAELMPVTEHPFYGSWGYQTTSYFAPTARYGTTAELMGFVDQMHAKGLGVILDWVPSHFPSDEFALGNFDGSHLFEHGDPKEGWHPDWKSYIFNYGRHEVRSFLVSSAISWIERYHIDGLRVDAVASMLYRDYSRLAGEWIPNAHGGRENLEAIQFLQELNTAIGERYPEVLTIAEESTAFPGVTRPVSDGGLGFHYKWDMGWMHDTLVYCARDSSHRRYHHNEITFRSLYAASENYVLPLSHDEVVHGKGSIVEKMAGSEGDPWRQFANLRLLYANQWLSPGKKLLFMGQEFAATAEWNHDEPLNWDESREPANSGIARLVSHLNHLYRAQPSLHELDNDSSGFEWLIMDDSENSVLAWLRLGVGKSLPLVCILNMTPVTRLNYRVGVPLAGDWKIILDTDDPDFGGSGAGQDQGRQVGDDQLITADVVGVNGRQESISLLLPPLAALVLVPAAG